VQPRRTGMVCSEERGHVEDRAVGVHRTVRSGIRPAGCPGFPDYPLDSGIRPASDTGSGEPDEVVVGEVSAHLGNPGSYKGL
jgi:hypothetical protein